MKKLLGISLVAVLAATPLMAFAAAGDIDKDPGATVSENAPVAANGPKYGLATSDATDANAASAGYVKGAYNAAIRAINSVDGRIDTINTNMDNKANKDFSNVAAGAIAKEKLATDVQTSLGKADTALQKADIVEGTANGTIKVDGDDVAVHGLGTAAYTAATDYATAAQGALADSALQKTDITTGSTAGTISVDGTDVAVNVQGFATEDGVKNTVKNTINNVTLTQGTVTNGAMQGELNATSSTIATIMTEWGSTTSTTPITAVTAVDKGTLASNVTVADPTINTVTTVTYTEQ